MPEWVTPEQRDLVGEAERWREAFAYERDTNTLMLESLADLQLAAEDKGWINAEFQADHEFSPEGRKRIATNCELVKTANPLAKRAVQLRTGYVWGEGISISCDADDTAEGSTEKPQDVNAILQEFIDDPRNRDVLFGATAHEDLESVLATHGEIFYSLPTNRLTGKVIVRTIHSDEIVDIITNPEDRNEPWFYKRQYVRRGGDLGETWATKTITVYYPALGYNPRGTDRVKRIGDSEVRWDEPIRAVIVNKPTSRAMRGVGDLYTVLPWVRASKEILEAWVLLFKALTRYAYQVKTRGDRTQQAARRIREAQAAPGPAGNPDHAGATYVGGNDSHLEAISKSGAQVDADGARPVQVMVAAGMGVPITMLLGDPGTTGARAVAETLDAPTKIVMGQRQSVHKEALLDICDYVINWSIKVGRLKGSITYDGSREIATLRGDQPRTVQIDFPPFESDDVAKAVEAIATANDLDVIPKALLLRLVLSALKVPDLDEIMEANTDEDGNWIDVDAEAQDQQARRGGQTGIAGADDGNNDQDPADSGAGADSAQQDGGPDNP